MAIDRAAFCPAVFSKTRLRGFGVGRGILRPRASRVLRLMGCAVGLIAFNPGTQADTEKRRPAAELSLSVREAHDSNLLLVSGRGAMTEMPSWLTTVSARASVDVRNLTRRPNGPVALALSYAPDLVIYHNRRAEDHSVHRFAAVAKANVQAWSALGDFGFSHIDGSKEATTYLAPDDARSAYATAAARDRREQRQLRGRAHLQRDRPGGFLRAAATWMDFDLRTELRNVAGYQNYPDRYDVNAGLDIGWKLRPELAFVLGYRRGHQHQDSLPFDPAQLSATSRYDRALVGLEGRIGDRFVIMLQAGPDFRDYGERATAPLNDKTPTTTYVDLSISAELTRNDTVSLLFKRWQWVAGTGKLPYADTASTFTYRRKLCGSVAAEIGFRYCESDYTGANVSASRRVDALCTGSGGFMVKVSDQLTALLSYTRESGRNRHEAIVGSQYREFDRTVLSASLVRRL